MLASAESITKAGDAVPLVFRAAHQEERK